MNTAQPQLYQSSWLRWLYSVMAIISLLFTALALKLNNPIELDSLLYIKAAEIFQQQGYMAAAQIYSWPFFSILLAYTQQLLSISYAQAGYLINAILQILIAINFVRLIQLLGGDKKTLIIAAIFILFYPYINKIRPYITRDFGYWAFALGGLFHLIQFYQKPRWTVALAWLAGMGIATLFRIEGALFLLFGPLIYLLPSSTLSIKQRVISLLKLYLPLLIIAALGLLWKSYHTSHTPQAMGRIPELLWGIQQGLIMALANIDAKVSIVEQYLLNNVAIGDAKLFLLGGLFSIFMGVILKTLNPVYLFLSAYGLRYRLLPAAPFIRHLLLYFIILNIIMLSIFLGQHFFMVDRYVIFLNLLLMLWLPFSINTLITQWQQTTLKSWLLPFLTLFFIGFALGGIIRFGYSKAYITEAGIWLKEYTPSNATLYSNSRQLLFYAERPDQQGQINYLNPVDINTLQADTLKHYQYIAIWQTKKDGCTKTNLLPKQQLIWVKTFQNKRGDSILIYKTLP